MAKYIKAKQVEAVEKKKDKVDGYEVTDKNTGVVTWWEKKAFELAFVKI